MPAHATFFVLPVSFLFHHNFTFSEISVPTRQIACMPLGKRKAGAPDARTEVEILQQLSMEMQLAHDNGDNGGCDRVLTRLLAQVHPDDDATVWPSPVALGKRRSGTDDAQSATEILQELLDGMRVACDQQDNVMTDRLLGQFLAENETGQVSRLEVKHSPVAADASPPQEEVWRRPRHRPPHP